MKEFEKKGSPSREGFSKFLPSSMSDASTRRRLTEYEVQVQDLQAYVSSLEKETLHLRKKLDDTPKEFMIIENKLREANRQLVQAFNQNEKLVNALYEAREQITALKEEVDKLCAPPSTYGVYLSPNEDGTVNILSQGRKVKVNLHPAIKVDTLRPGQELILNEGLNVVEAAGYEIQGDVVVLKEQLGEKIKGYFLNIKGPELLNKYVGETERKIREIFTKAKEKAADDVPVVVFFDEMDALFRTRGTGISSDVETTIVPQLLAEIDGVEGLKNVIVIGASNRQDLIDPAILRPGRLDVKIKIERPDQGAASDIFHKYLTTEIPIAESETKERSGDMQGTIDQMIRTTIEAMYSLSEENRFLEVTYANGDKEVLYFKDFSSGAMIESVVRRAKKLALKRYIGGGEKGITTDDLLTAVREEFKENEDLPNTTNPDDWAKIAGKKGERIVYVKPLMGDTKDKQRNVEKVVNTGQYL